MSQYSYDGSFWLHTFTNESFGVTVTSKIDNSFSIKLGGEQNQIVNNAGNENKVSVLLNPYVDFLLGSTENKIGLILLDRAKYGRAHPETIIRGAIANLNVSTKLLQNTGTILKWGGRAFGALGIVGTAIQWRTGEIGTGEALLDTAFGVAGFIPGYGWAVSGAYFLIVKPLYKEITEP
jgi:hypothetical protein